MIGHDFPYLDTRDLNLDWLIKNMKQILLDWAEYQQTMNQSFANLEAANTAFKNDLTAAFNTLHDFVDDYFDNLNVQTEINNKLDAMRRSGELAEIMNPLIASQTSAWLAEHITNPSNPPIDTSLSVAGTAADAKITGDRITDLRNEITNRAEATWNQGGINVSTGAFSPLTYRIRTLLDEYAVFITAPSGFNFGVFAFNGNEYIGVWNGSTFAKAEHWFTGYLDIHTPQSFGYTLYLVGGYINNAQVTPSDGGNFVIRSGEIERINDEITEINGEISEINDEITAINNNLREVADVTWVQGGINVSSGDFLPMTYRIRTLLDDYAIFITAASGFNFGIFAFNDDEYIGVWNGSAFAKAEHWFTGYLDIHAPQSFGYTLYLVGGYINNAQVTPSDGSNFTVYANRLDKMSDEITEIKENSIKNGLCPNIIFQARNVDDLAIPPESKWYIKAAAHNEYDRVRCTVRKTTDGYYFLCHDPFINNVARNMDGSEITETVSTAGKTLAELNQYDWGIKYGAQYAGASVPLLTDFLKYAALYNLGVTWHSATTDVETDAAFQEQIALIDKYGLTDNLIVITSSGFSMSTFRKFLAHNPRVSYYVGGLPEFFEDTDNINYIKELQTDYNRIYVQLFPWGTAPTDEFIQFAKTNNFLLYDSITMSKTDLLNENTFNKGYSLMEVNDVRMIKSTIRKWADGLIG